MCFKMVIDYLKEGNAMLITGLSKKKRNTYQVTLENSEQIILFDDIIVKYSLLPKKEISDCELKMIREENHLLESYYLTISYLSTKMRSKKEVIKFLEKKNFEKKEINSTIEKLEKEKLLDEMIYARSFLNDTFRFSNDGPLKIYKRLSDLGIKEENIDSVLKEFDQSLWEEKCAKLITKKALCKHNDSAIKWQWKCINYCFNLGYPKEMILKASSSISWGDNQETIKKEYEKIKRKLERKFSGTDLIFQIKRKLYEKGYQKEDLERIEE